MSIFSNAKAETFDKWPNSFLYKDHVKGFYFDAVLLDGELKISTRMIDTERGERSHRRASELYAEMINHFGIENIYEIHGIWQSGTNFKQFYHNVDQLGMDFGNAAFNTWSGQMARKNGFTMILGNVEFDDIPFSGESRLPVYVVFVRPEYFRNQVEVPRHQSVTGP